MALYKQKIDKEPIMSLFPKPKSGYHKWIKRQMNKLLRRIPEFKPETFNVCPTDVETCWWAPSDRESRIKAFDKLIKIYSW